jgi:hypothetical protein
MSLFYFLTSRKEFNVYQHDIHIQRWIQGGGEPGVQKKNQPERLYAFKQN